LNINYLTNELTQYQPILVTNAPEDSFQKLKLLSPNIKVNREDLILGSLSDFKSIELPSQSKNIVCLCGDAAQEAIVWLNSRNINGILIPGDGVDFLHLHNLIVDRLYAYDRTSGYADFLLGNIAQDGGGQIDLQEVLRISFDVFNNPVALISPATMAATFRDSSLSPFAPFHEKTWLSIIREFGEKIASCNELTISNPFFIDGFGDITCRVLVAPINVPDVSLSYLTIFEQHTFHETDYLTSNIFSSWICSRIRYGFIRFGNYDDDSSIITQYMLELLGGHPQGKNSEMYNTVINNIKLHRYYRMLLLDITRMKYKNETPNSLAEKIVRNINRAFFCIYKDYIVLLLNSSEVNCNSLLRKLPLDTLCAENDLYCGISYGFTSISDLAPAYEQAQAAIRLGKQFYPHNRTFNYDDTVLEHLLSQYEGSMLKSFCHPMLTYLIEYDRINNTSYSYTLFVLIMCSGNRSEAARKLNIHRSTLQYRIDKIVDLTGFDMFNTYDVARLYMSYKILLLTGDLSSSEYSTK